MVAKPLKSIVQVGGIVTIGCQIYIVYEPISCIMLMENFSVFLYIIFFFIKM